MNQTEQSTLKFWKITAALSKLLLGLVVAAWLTFGLAWMALHWVIVPRIGELRPRLEIELLAYPFVLVKFLQLPWVLFLHLS
jgi:hypothetical protein